VLEIVPRVALHVTAVFVVFVTVAVNCCVQPDGTDTVCGEMLTATAGIVTVMVAFPDLLVSSVLVAVTVADPAVAGAVKLPFALTVPALADHVTAELKLPVPVTVGAQDEVPFVRTDVGEQATVTDVMVGFWFEDDDPPPPLADYVALVARCGLYPGSPALTRALLRPQDRLVCCELHPEEHAALRRAYAHDRQVAVHLRDAWEALGALLPPEEKRGVVLVDPPYEASDEYERLVAGLLRGHARFPSGVFVAWYPVKHLAPVRALHTALRESGVRDVVAAELNLREPLDPARLNGSGLLVINPPYRFEAEVPALLEALLRRLGTGEAGAGVAVERLVDE